jgi:hypothetical protein
MPIELAKEHPEGAKFLVKADKNGGGLYKLRIQLPHSLKPPSFFNL